jgi:hypothetical protein
MSAILELNAETGGKSRTVYSLKDSGGFVHPWQVSVFPRGAKKNETAKWACSVEPGFVNGIDPRVPIAEAEESDRRELAKKGSGKDVVIGLCDRPQIPVRGFVTVGNPLPYFEVMGVRKASAEKVSVQGGMVVWDQTNAEDTGPKQRWLQQSQVYLSRARATYKMDATIEGNLVTGQIVDYTVSYNTRALEMNGSRARIYTAAEMPAKVVPPIIQDRLAGQHGDDGEDRVLIATIYFLSPSDFKPPDDPKVPMPEPDERWTPYVRHNIFWNLCCAAKNLPPVNVKQTGSDPFLSYFVGRYTVAPMATLGAMQAESQRMLAAALNSSNNEGRFWTA